MATAARHIPSEGTAAQLVKRGSAALPWITLLAALLAQLLAFSYGYGTLQERVSTIDKRTERMERILLERGARAGD